jgi:hypothetical protein
LNRRNVAVNVDCTKTLVAVPVTKIEDAVTSVLPIEMVQLDVFSVADSVTSVTRLVDCVDETTMPVVVEPTKTAVAVSNGTSIRNHAVPSLAIAQSVLPAAVDVTGKNRFVTLAVFGVAV